MILRLAVLQKQKQDFRSGPLIYQNTPQASPGIKSEKNLIFFSSSFSLFTPGFFTFANVNFLTIK